MIFGYARVSTKEQNLDLQIDALAKAGCEDVFSEKLSGRSEKKPKLEELISKLRKGDMVVVYSLDRLGRTSKELINLLSDFKEKGIQFKSLQEGIFDTTSAMGEAVFQIIAILKAMEVQVLSERTKDGLAAARARGKKGGRPKGSYDKNKAAAAVTLYQRDLPISEITKSLNISRSTLYQYLRNEGIK
ncbi:recombinase family protein [Reichenbachiella versicolor]|uniref:recombinase family protein n=1 Tax=Reichenbachiella versicolor TaxID=1821036 RepID=UPI000D6E0581|nr:recombinase family protein [Reichenbachiella versicolor]